MNNITRENCKTHAAQPIRRIFASKTQHTAKFKTADRSPSDNDIKFSKTAFTARYRDLISTKRHRIFVLLSKFTN